MNSRKVTIILLVCVFGLFAAAVGSAGTGLQQAALTASEPGRYRMVAQSVANGAVYMNDTATGECWQLSITAKKWVKVAPPVSTEK